MAQDIVRVLRVIEYVGPRELVEKQVALSIHGIKEFGNGIVIRAATVNPFPDVVESKTPVGTLNLNARAMTVLRYHGVTTVQELTKLTAKDVLRMINSGKSTLKEIRDKLQTVGKELNLLNDYTDEGQASMDYRKRSYHDKQ